MRLIDADVLKDGKFHSIEDWTPVERASWQWGWNDAIDAIINSAPTVDPIKHGHWKAWYHGDCNFTYSCSICGLGDSKESTLFCPNCGARMDEVTTDGT